MRLAEQDPRAYIERAAESTDRATIEREIRAAEAHRVRMRTSGLSKIGNWTPRLVNNALDALYLRLGIEDGASRGAEGKAGAALLSRLIDDRVTGERSRRDIIVAMTEAAGFDQGANDPEGTTNQIVAGTIGCPPLPRLQGFARALGVGVGQLRSAFERDGCTYG